MDRDEKRYKTKNTPLSAWLILQKCKLLTVEKDGNRSYFYFRDTPALRDAVELWKSGKPLGDTRGFYEAYRKVLEMVKNNGKEEIS